MAADAISIRISADLDIIRHAVLPRQEFTYPAEQEENAERLGLMCVVCLDPLQQPVEIGPCGHMLCAVCLLELCGERSSSNCPTCQTRIATCRLIRTVAILGSLNSLLVMCPNDRCRNGTVERSQLARHIPGCPARCPSGCSTLVAPENLEDHVGVCEAIGVSCGAIGCLWKGPRGELPEHTASRHQLAVPTRHKNFEPLGASPQLDRTQCSGSAYLIGTVAKSTGANWDATVNQPFNGSVRVRYLSGEVSIGIQAFKKALIGAPGSGLVCDFSFYIKPGAVHTCDGAGLVTLSGAAPPNPGDVLEVSCDDGGSVYLKIGNGPRLRGYRTAPIKWFGLAVGLFDSSSSVDLIPDTL